MTKPPFTSSWEVPDAASWQRTGDRLADLVIESGLFKPSAIKYENILRLLAEKERQQQVAEEEKEQENEKEKQNKKELNAEVLIYREIIDELERVPAWVDWARIERGRRIYQDHLVLINAGLAVALIEAYSFPIDAQVLYISGGLTASRRAATRRLMETGYWVFTVMKEGLRVGSKGHAACVNVRLIHALARKLCLMSPEWASDDARRRSEPTTDGPDETLLMKFVKLSAEHQTKTEAAGNQSQNACQNDADPMQRVHGELPINQANLLGTLFLFCHVCLEVARMRGARITQEDKESYWHLWRYIGHLLGIDEGLMPATYDDGLAARLGELYRARQQPDHTSRLLAVSTVDAMASLPSIPFNRPLFNVSIRRFLGHSLCDALGIESVNVVTTVQWWVSKYVYVLCDLFNVLLPPLQRLQSGLFFRFVDEVYRDYFTIHLHPTTTVTASMGAFCPVLAAPATGADDAASAKTAPEVQKKVAPTAAKQWLRCPFGG